MENAKDEEYYLLIPNPVTDSEEEFDLNRQSNVGLAMRLIRKRENIMESMRSNFKKLEKVREEKDVDSIEDRMEGLLDEITELSLSEFEDEEEYEKRSDELEEKLNEVKSSYPQKVIDLQNKTAEQVKEVDRIGVKICTIVLEPTEGVPEEYPSKKDYIEEFIASDQDIQDVITFFLSTLNSTMRSRKGVGIQMKKRSDKRTQKE